MQQLYLELRLHIDPVVVLRGRAIDILPAGSGST
jgi:hypothetical protein